MRSLHRTYPMVGPYTLHGRTLMFRTDNLLLSFTALTALTCGRVEFAVMLIGSQGLKEVEGTVLSVTRPGEGTSTRQWEITMRVWT